MVDHPTEFGRCVELILAALVVLGLGLALVNAVGCTPVSGPCNDPNYVAGDPESPCHMNPQWRTGL
jgi:hypothetical protein